LSWGKRSVLESVQEDSIPLWSPDPAHRKFGHDYIRSQLRFPVPFTRQEPMRSSGIVAQ
jgi:hypothetical protein